MSANFVTSLKRQVIAIETDGPKAPVIIGGKKSPSLITTLNLVLGTITLNCMGVHIGCMYDVASGGFNWTDQDYLMTIKNTAPAASGGIFDSGAGPGTLIQRSPISDPGFSTIFLPQG